jgi:hypothetical protein
VLTIANLTRMFSYSLPPSLSLSLSIIIHYYDILIRYFMLGI